MSTFTVRPSNSEKDAFRIKLTAASLLSLKLKSGDLCTLHLPTDKNGSTLRTAIAWENSGGGMKDNIVQTSKVLQDTYSLKLGDRVTIQRSLERLEDATSITLSSLDSQMTDDDHKIWAFNASSTIPMKHDVLAHGQQLVIEVGSSRREFQVQDIGGSLARINSSTKFSFGSTATGTQQSSQLESNFERVGGLKHQIEELERLVKRLSKNYGKEGWADYRPSQGVLLYGAKGTGKTLIQKALAKGGWLKVVWWSPGTKVSSIQGTQLILMDLSRAPDSGKVVDEIIALFNSVEDSSTLVVGCISHPNDISTHLRSNDTFSIEIELPIPNADQRLDILKALRNESTQPSDIQLEGLAAKTHGFVGADLNMLLHAMWNSAIDRYWDDKKSITQQNGDQPPKDDSSIQLTPQDIEHAMSSVRPSALKEIFLEKPNVHWTDIGGQHEIKKQLQKAVEYPLKYPERMKNLGLQPKKGILLYGPPGCSKTLTVKALATEAGLNFIAVKGAELISMYVGESEKATREVFRKARQASPSIIFFDEIDAIASRGRSGSDLNVLTTLLNEMDGFEELKGVLVVAATNKPQSIDPALMRPGRFDNVVYVGPPDFETRKEIFDKRFAHISVEETVRSSTADFANATDGLSGAEVVAVCQAAGESAMDNDRDIITVGDVYAGITQTPRSITCEMLKEYEDWNAARVR